MAPGRRLLKHPVGSAWRLDDRGDRPYSLDPTECP